jgi:coenzyme PQQ precursor peptide PqqA
LPAPNNGLDFIECRPQNAGRRGPWVAHQEDDAMMAWKNPTLIEIRVGLEINGYLPAEF